MTNSIILLEQAEREITSNINGKPTTELALSLVSAAQQALMYAETVDEVKDIRDKLNGIETYLKRQKAELINSNLVTAQRLRTERALGEMIPDKFPQGRHSHDTLSSHGIHPKQSSRWQRLASIDEQDFELYVQDQLEQDEITTAGLLRWFMNIHISDDSYEWNTPPEIIEAARAVMGQIDLDPATNEVAQEYIKAETYYTAEDDGLSQKWYGYVWLNPPYSMPYIEQFVDRSIYEYENGNIKGAIILVNNSTDTRWFHRLMKYYPVCFTEGRLPFTTLDGNKLATRQGQAIFYLGQQPDHFDQIFSEFGVVLKRYDD